MESIMPFMDRKHGRSGIVSKVLASTPIVAAVRSADSHSEKFIVVMRFEYYNAVAARG